MAVERKTFREIFQENSDGTMSLLHDIKVKGTEFKKDTSFNDDEGLGGIDFHQFRYLDVAVKEEDDSFVIEGFYAKNTN